MSDDRFHKLEIEGASYIGMGTKTLLDGKPVVGVREITTRLGMMEPNVITLEMIVDFDKIEIEGEVAYELVLSLDQERSFRVQDGSIASGLRHLADKVEDALR